MADYEVTLEGLKLPSAEALEFAAKGHKIAMKAFAQLGPHKKRQAEEAQEVSRFLKALAKRVRMKERLERTD